MHRITDNRMTGTVSKNLDMFGRLCGDRAAKRVRMVTTMWDKAKDRNVAETRASELENKFWKPLIDEGARHHRFRNTRESAWNIIHDATGNPEALLLQEELVDTEMRLNETIAGKALYSQYQKCFQTQKETMKQLLDEAKMQQDPAMARVAGGAQEDQSSTGENAGRNGEAEDTIGEAGSAQGIFQETAFCKYFVLGI